MAESRRTSPWRWLLYAYLALLAISHLVWAWRGPDTRDPSTWMKVRPLPVFDAAGEVEGGQTLLAYDDEGPGPVTIVFLHGSPGSHSDFDKLRTQLPEAWRCISIDLPGFGVTSGPVPDYSIAAHARIVDNLLNELGVEQAHYLGFSMGGGVGLELYELAPERCLSFTLLAAIGVQELELFGSYEMNHAVHAMQLGLLQGARWLLPHFGRFDGQMLNVAYARNFFDTDQRPLRAILERFEPPLLIVHGEDDFLVPAAAAREHHRIVPQSELAMLKGSHFLPWMQTGEVVSALVPFIEAAQAGTATTRSTATQERLTTAAEPWDPKQAPPFEGPTLFTAFLLLMAATLVSEDLTCVGAGLLVAQGRIGFVAASAACFLGILIGDVLLFMAGRFLGRPAVERAPLKWMLNPAAVERASQWFANQGGKVIILSRFMPGLRLPTYFSAGVLRTRFATFLFFFTLAGIVWTPALVGLAAWIGLEALDLFQGYALPAMLTLVGLLVILRKVILPLLGGRRSRRLWMGGLRRRMSWEFWPRWMVYPPVLLYVVWLSLRYGGMRQVCAANPGISLGGLVGESKSAILEGLGGANEPLVGKFRKLPAEWTRDQREQAIREIQAHQGQPYPIVIKPDVGERGRGVQVVHDDAQLAELLGVLEGHDYLVQAFVPGQELGVFWLRPPGAERGEIFSVTRKVLPTVVGDGTSTVEELILADRRAVTLAPTYFDGVSERLQDVPTQGEAISLVEIGTHCLGAIFLDGRADLPPAAAETIEQLSRRFEGFHFGRYDLRIHDPAAFEEGRGFGILELNGLTAEPAHIYDPAIGIFEAYGTLFRQWKMAFRIGSAQRKAGAPVPSWLDIWRALRA